MLFYLVVSRSLRHVAGYHYIVAVLFSDNSDALSQYMYVYFALKSNIERPPFVTSNSLKCLAGTSCVSQFKIHCGRGCCVLLAVCFPRCDHTEPIAKLG
jgi:hypothetical protein